MWRCGDGLRRNATRLEALNASGDSGCHRIRACVFGRGTPVAMGLGIYAVMQGCLIVFRTHGMRVAT